MWKESHDLTLMKIVFFLNNDINSTVFIYMPIFLKIFSIENVKENKRH